MHTQTIYELSQEAERLLLLSLEHLKGVTKMPTVTLNNARKISGDTLGPVQPLHFSACDMDVPQAMLSNELRKISRLEMVLAIVGTMKAGKSTTINAIVGTEVLPNRNRPMTALPTLIRHTPGQKEPVLHFPHVAPIDSLMLTLQQRMHMRDRQHLIQVLEIDKDMDALLQRIENGVAFERCYLGAQPIFHCLKSLNDLVRLSKALEVDFPFAAYAAIEHIPVIDVEFVHLEGLEKFPGQLTLLDTPGPNEAGQPHLQKMLNEQLARASAVLAVMDYTQLKSISDEEVRHAIAAVGKSVPLFALVNKFDQKDRNSDDEEQVRAMISGTLMKGCITPGHIYPVSSMWGYLANRARHELAVNGRLPDHQEQRWVQDFAEAALGRRWRSADLDDIDHIRHAARLLWEDSLFEQPIQALIHAAYANASLYALRSASQKLLNYAQNVREYLDFRYHGLTVAYGQLQQNILHLEADMQQLQVSQKAVRDEVEHEVERALASASVFITRQQGEILRRIDSDFSREQVLQMARYERFPLLPAAEMTEGLLILHDEGQAQVVLSKIRSSCEGMLLAAQETISCELTLHFEQLEATLSRTLNDAMRPIEKRVKEELSHAGFHVRIGLPAFQASLFNFDTRQLFSEAIAEEKSMDNLAPRAGGVRETFSRWLNQPDWGGNEQVEARARYSIDIKALHRSLEDYVRHFCQQIYQALAVQVDVSVTAGMATFFAEFSLSLAGLQESLRETLLVRQQHESAVTTLSEQLQHSIAANAWIYEDSRLLRDDIQTLFAAEHT
ncbi:clamp-binding protein CrfC [Citrobacter amalonaticus]|uniref:Clamp-binding protein CrfC n=1 Tax=Citrobacter amalonaticus TaxID=35703 RepID=A0A2S4RU40_CITAM|nr:clamp-binding protein CrfC [Citrobacter amalonaticus]POT57086.1 clamp-binding protein CrfC [Citrobacter amalonaticus]POT72625.1 clamp-binding protein CrfC [Citrobacter amalonaticus]POU63480.1 clamp-binding protein CrfC [Citrobacter amalonaticus]POV03244.1 clamp-binding protein CrfC [Citrobacter amalonaticus]